ncbi:MAG TPA: cytochrome-c oxidase, cbb3-type subunit II [Burkholderiaceae bacterium]|nr:cytochrome-c oxidase, cbb3-type subunit II [Burkholderiaceae bacterium]
MKLTHDRIEQSVPLLIVLVILTIAVGGLVEIVPLFFQRNVVNPVKGIQPYEPLRLAGRDIYIREGCYNCHSQMIRPFRAETLRYGHYSVAGEFVFDHPFQWGSKRTGPDLARIGGRYSDDWHRIHFNNPRDVVPESNMPAYPWFAKTKLDGSDIQARMKALRTVGVPYTDEQIAKAPEALKDKSELDAVLAYLQGLGVELKGLR